MKKIIPAVLLLMTLCGTAFTQNASDFTVDANGVITKYTGFDTVVVIPATIGGRKITAIGKEAFYKADLTSVTIPEGVTTIGVAAFYGNKLASIAFPNGVTLIEGWAFENNRLTSVTIPGSVKYIEDGAFMNNTTLATIVISEGVEQIGDKAFANTKCTSVSLPSTINSMANDAFDISGKPSFTLAADINDYFDDIPAFYSYIANDRKAGTYAFNLPLTRKKADDYEYYETRYGAVLIRYTGDSTRVRIPSTIGGIAVKALYGTWYSKYDFAGIFRRKKIAAVQIPEGITYIGGIWTFAENELANVTIPDSVTYIGDNAFYKNQLTSVTIPNNVKYIGVGAFGGNKLNNIIIPNSVMSIGYRAFINDEGYHQLTSVTIGSNVVLGNYHDGYNYRTVGAFDSYSDFDYCYNSNKKAPGIYIYADGKWTKQQTVPFPVGFVGTWKRDNSDTTLTFAGTTLKSSIQNFSWILSRISGDSYTIFPDFYPTIIEEPITIKLVNGNIEISNGGTSESTWNGTWKKIN